MTATLGFVGLGAMGGRMARRLLDGGFTLHGYNRTAAKAADLVAAGMKRVASPREAAERAEAVFTMVTDDAALDAVTRGPQGILAGLRPGAILIEMSTVSPAVIHRLADEVAARGAALLDAPVSGSPATLDAGQLSFMVGGDPAVLERARPFLAAIGPTMTHVGPAGLAKSMKIAVNQGLAVQMLVVRGVGAARREGRRRARAGGRGAAEERGRLADGEVPRPVRPRHARRGLVRRGHDAEGPPPGPRHGPRLRASALPSVALTHELLTAAKGLGLAKYDFAVLFDVLAQMAGFPPSKKL